MMINNGNFPAAMLPGIRRQLGGMSKEQADILESIEFKNPTTALIISVLIGSFGIDRFYVGDTGLGVAKLLTCGGLGVWTIVDWFMIMNRARQINYEKLLAAIA